MKPRTVGVFLAVWFIVGIVAASIAIFATRNNPGISAKPPAGCHWQTTEIAGYKGWQYVAVCP